jgi:hypothetical protein
MKTPEVNHYLVFRRQGLDRMYYGVAGKNITYADATLFLTEKEAQAYADKLNSKETV